MSCEVIQDRIRGFSHGLRLGGGQGGEEELPDASDVGRGCGTDGRETGVGKTDEWGSRVIAADFAVYADSLLHAADVVGQSAFLPLQFASQLPGSEDPVRGLGEDGETS